MNKHMVIGYVGKDPEIRTFNDGNMIASFSVATSFRYKNKDGERIEQTDWHNVVASGPLASSVVSPYVKKGSRVYVSGRSINRKWKDKDGQDRYITEIKMDEIELLSDAGERKESQPAQQARPAARPAPSRAGAGAAVPNDIDEDIPFAPMSWKGMI